MKRNGWLKFFYIFYCVKSTVLCPGRAVQIVYLQHSLQLISARINSVAKALHVPISLWRYLVLATLAPGLISKQCVTVLRLPGLRALESQTATLLGRTMSTEHLRVDSPSLLSALALQLWSRCPKLCKHKHPLPTYTIFRGDVAAQIHGKQCSWQEKEG